MVREKPGDGAQQRRFAAAVGAAHLNAFAGIQGKADPVKQPPSAADADNLPKGEKRTVQGSNAE